MAMQWTESMSSIRHCRRKFPFASSTMTRLLLLRVSPPAIQASAHHVRPMEREHVVLHIDAMAAKPARHPSIRQRLREADIDLVTRHGDLRPGGGHAKTCSRDRRDGTDAHSDDMTHIH